MFSYFIKNRHGVISIFCAIILIAILSFSSLMVEMGRMRSLNSLFDEAVGNGAFAILSNYDEDLYKRFALMALSENVDVDTLEGYIRTSLNEYNTDAKKLDTPIELKEVTSFDKMYDLTNEDVLRKEIEEAEKYRAPVSILDNQLNFTDNIVEFFTAIKKSVPIMEYFEKVLNYSEKITDYFKALMEYQTSVNDFENIRSEYATAAEDYNNAVNAYEDLDTTSADYEEEKSVAATAREAAANKLKNIAIPNLESAKNEMLQKKNEHNVAKEAVMGEVLAGITGVEINKVESGDAAYNMLTTAEKENYLDLLYAMMPSNADNSFGALIDCLQEWIDKCLDSMFDEYIQAVNDSKSSIGADSWEEYTVIDLDGYKEVLAWAAIVQSLISAIETVLELVQTMITALKDWLSLFMGFAALSSMGYLSDINCIGNIYGIPNNQLPSNIPNNDYTQIVSQDSITASNILNDATAVEVASDLGYHLEYIDPTINNTEYTIGTIMSMLIENFTNMVNEITALAKGTYQTISRIIQSIIDILSYGLKIIVALNTLAALIVGLTLEALKDYIFRMIILAHYVSYVFPNRTTDMTQNDLFGNNWASDRSDGWAPHGTATNVNFYKARAEYVLIGTDSEILNQIGTFGIVLGFRAIVNLPGLLSEKELLKTLGKLCATLIGIIVAIIIVVILCLVEGMLDMFVLVCCKSSVPIVKLKWWITGNNIDDLADKLKSGVSNCVAQNEGAAKLFFGNEFVDSLDENGVKFDAKEFAVEALTWDYTEHMMYFLCYIPKSWILKRAQNLIQIELNQIKGGGYRLSDAATYVRIEAVGKYYPLLPIPTIPGTNSTYLERKKIIYQGYY